MCMCFVLIYPVFVLRKYITRTGKENDAVSLAELGLGELWTSSSLRTFSTCIVLK